MDAYPTTRADRNYAKWVHSTSHALDIGDIAHAEQYLGLLAQTHPKDAEYLRLQAIAYDARGRTYDAVTTMRQALALRPNDAACHNTMACLFDHAYEFDSAVKCAYRAVQLDPNFATAWYNLSVVLAHVGCYKDAVSALRRTQKLDPTNPNVRAKLADALRDSGLISEAANGYREILRERPWAGTAWLGLADLKTIRFDIADVAAMRSAAGSPHATVDDQVAISYSLAKALEDTGDYEGSLQTLVSAKARQRQRQGWDPVGFSRSVTSILDAFNPPPTGSDMQDLGREVIFIVGMPRSGTTLVEQILASHQEVEGGGELTDLAGVLAEESGSRNRAFPDWVQYMTSNDWSRLGYRYLERTQRHRRSHAVFTDKLPSNWTFVGAVLAMLPSARIVCCRRDPLETCFSNYRQYRARVEYTGSFSDLASLWRDYDRSIRSWRSRYPNQVFEHSYEGLLADPADSTRKLLSNCGLTWDARCLNFWTTSRDVHTPSAAQVRKPLALDTARAARYGDLLDPLRKSLGLSVA